MPKAVVSLVAVGFILCFSGLAGVAQNAGQAIYKEKCQMCHGADGLANTPAGKARKALPFNSPEVLKESDADLFAITKNGKNKMPAFASKLSDAEINEVLAYIHTLQKKP